MGEIQRNEVPVSAPEFRIENNATQVRTVHEGGVVPEMAVAIYDVSGGDDGAIGTHGLGVHLPDKAVVTRVFYDVITTFTSSTDAATIALGLETQDTDAFKTAVAISDGGNPWDAGQGDGIQDGAATNMVKTTDERELVVVVATEALTAGKLVLYVEYVIGA